MKRFIKVIFTLLSLSTTTASFSASCPNFSGSYSCKSTHLPNTISQNIVQDHDTINIQWSVNGVATFAESRVLTGEIALVEDLGFLKLSQINTCYDDSIVTEFKVDVLGDLPPNFASSPYPKNGSMQKYVKTALGHNVYGKGSNDVEFTLNLVCESN